MKDLKMKDTLVVGFAIFAMFFGAGNLIFPPFLGMRSGSNWFLAFICFIVMDIGLSILTLLVMTKIGRGAKGITEKLGDKASVFILAANVICLGPLIAIPRTAATAYEFAVQPFFPAVSTTVFSIIFFSVVVLFCLKQSKVIDIIGTFFGPLMLAALVFLIVKGIVTPLGTIQAGISAGSSVQEGIGAGYQTMDVMAAMVFSASIFMALKQKGYGSDKQQFKMISASGALAALILFVVYGGLAYLGATVSGMFPPDVDRVQLLIAITGALLGEKGTVLLGVLVCAACLTPAIGLLSSSAAFFEKQSKGKVKYPVWVVGFAAASCAISNFGISRILALASPVLNVLYPVLVLLIFLGLFRKFIPSDRVYRFAVFGAAAVSVCSVIEPFVKLPFSMTEMPLYQFGFQWLIPALLFGVLGASTAKLRVKLPPLTYGNYYSHIFSRP